MKTKVYQIKRYPSACTSAYCGAASCDGCPNKPALDRFKAWCAEFNAQQVDPIWSPGTWQATDPQTCKRCAGILSWPASHAPNCNETD